MSNGAVGDASSDTDGESAESGVAPNWTAIANNVTAPRAPVDTPKPSATPSQSRTLHPRQQTGHRGSDGPPPFFEGQAVATGSPKGGSDASDSSATSPSNTSTDRAPAQGAAKASVFQGLPSESGAIQRYLTHRYKGVGEKTAEQVVEAFGVRVFEVLDAEPQRVTEILSDHRAEALLQAWQADKARRTE